MHTLDKALIQAVGLSVRLGGLTVVKNLRLEVNAGDRIAILGKSGAGKSTLLRGLVGFPALSKGDLYLFGESLATSRSIDIRRLRSMTSHISQGFDVIDDLSSVENVLLGDFEFKRLPSLANLFHSKQAREKALQILEKYGLLDKSETPVSQLSGGERQRVAIARALISNPRVIFADEPVSALDVETGRMVMQDLERISESGVAVVAALHQVELALDWAKKIVVMSKGEILAQGDSSSFDSGMIKSLIAKS